jgi:chromate reductase
MKILVISGSSRRHSLNTRLAHLVADVRPADTITVIADLHRLPFYDGDLEAVGTPDAVAELRAAVADADHVVIVTPEYNGTIPGLLANAVDWLSRPAGQSVLRDKQVVVLSASPTRSGGARAAEHLRAVLARLGATVSPTGLSIATAHQRLSDNGPDPQVATDLTQALTHALGPAPAPIPASA